MRRLSVVVALVTLIVVVIVDAGGGRGGHGRRHPRPPIHEENSGPAQSRRGQGGHGIHSRKKASGKKKTHEEDLYSNLYY